MFTGVHTLPKIYAIIPALNEEQTIGTVVKSLLTQGVTGVITVDNGSSDLTAEYAYKAGAKVITETQKGYGKACLTGISALPEEAEWVLFCDADGSDDLSELPEFFQQLTESDFLIGNRRATAAGRANLTPVQNFGNWFSGFLMKVGWGAGFSDLGPLRMIRKSSLENLEMQDENFGWTVEMQAKALTAQIRTVEIPVNYLPRQGGESKISGNLWASFQAGRIILCTLGKLWAERGTSQRVLSVFSVLMLLLGALLIGSGGDPASQEGARRFFMGAGSMGAGYTLSFLVKSWKPVFLFTAAVVMRLCLLPAPPGDDLWRYLWEGMIQNHGFSPYAFSPDSSALSSLRPSWWTGINHKEVSALYPPLAQLIFRLLSAISPSVILYKGVFMVADLLIGVVLYRSFSGKASWYLLNPLVLYCFTGAAHYEPLFLLPLTGAWLVWIKKRKDALAMFRVGALLGLSFSLKYVSLLAISYGAYTLIRRCFSRETLIEEWKRLIFYTAGVVVVPLFSYLLFSALLTAPDPLVPKAFTDTARSAELLPWILDYFFTDPYYPHLDNKVFIPALSVCLGCVTLSASSFAGFQIRAFLALLCFSPMIHCWYFTWLVPFCLTRHTLPVISLSLTGFLYFLLPYRQSLGEGWILHNAERLLLWSPLLLLLPELIRFFRRRIILPAVKPFL